EHQRVPGEAQDPLVELATLGERLHHVGAARLPRLRGGRQLLRPGVAAEAPEGDETHDPQERQESGDETRQRFRHGYPFRFLTAKACAYSSGFAGSNLTP